MRKTLSIILSVVMLLSVCSFAIPASAATPEGIAINTADEFMAMVSTPADSAEITAKYYLASDITLAGTYAEPFWGILDGNGHTVSVTAPMFADFSGEVKNLNIKGDIYFTDANAAAFTVLSAKGLNATNCKNDANVTITGNAKWAAGFLADCENNAVPCVFTNCVNNGDIYVDSTADEKMRAGGFAGIIDSAIFYNCVNNGDIYMKGNICIAGGLVSRVCLHASTYTAEAYNCVNTGNITVVDTHIGKDGVSFGTGAADAGGIFGHIGCKNQSGYYKIWGCRNDGKITAPYRVGGMVGYVYASKTDAFVDVQFCINTGDIVYGRLQKEADVYDYGSPFVGYTNSFATTIKYNIDVGSLSFQENTVTSKDGHSFIGLSSQDPLAYDVQSNYVLNREQYKYYSYAHDVDYPNHIIELGEAAGIVQTTLEDVKSGKVCYLLNEAAKNDPYGMAAEGYAFYQNLGSDDYPTVDSTHSWVNLSNGTYVNGEKPVETEPQETEPQETEPQETETRDPMEPVNVFDAEDIKTVTGGDPNNMTQDCLTLEDGYVHVVPIGSDPYWYPFAGVDGARYVAIRYRTDATGADMQLYMASTGTGPQDDTTMIRQPVVADGEWQLVIFDTQSLIDAEKYDGKYVSYFRFDPLEAGYILNADGEPYKNEDGTWARYSLPEGCFIDIAYIAFFHSEEAAKTYNFEQYKAPDWVGSGVVTHLSFDELDTFSGANKVAGVFTPGQSAGWDGVITLSDFSVDALRYWGWIAGTGDLGQFGYQINGGSAIYNDEWTHEEDMMAHAPAGSDHARRMQIMISLAGLSGENTIRVLYRNAAGKEACLTEFTVIAPKQDDHNFTSDVASNFAESQDDVEIKYADIAELFDQIHWGGGVPMYAKYNGGNAFYNVTHFTSMHTQPTGLYAFNVNVVSTAGSEGFASMFVRGVQIATNENHFFGQDGNDAGGVSMGGSGIYINYVPRGTAYALRINVKTYENGQYIPNVYYAPVGSSDITVTDDGSTVSIFAGDKLAATIVISGVKDYGISTDHGSTPADALAEKAIITTAEGTFELNNACVAATIEGSDLGIATRTGTFDFDRVALKPYTSVEIPTDFYVPVVRENIAEGKPVSSDNVENDSNIPSNATDGDLNSRYGALPNGEANLIVDLEQVYTLNGLTISFENALWKYEIAVSEDGVEYEVIHESEAHGATTKILELDNVSARYIKLTRLADDGATHYWFSIYELYVYAADAE